MAVDNFPDRIAGQEFLQLNNVWCQSRLDGDCCPTTGFLGKIYQLLCSDSIFCQRPLNKDILSSCNTRSNRIVMLVHTHTAHNQVDIRIRSKLFG